MGPLLAQKKPPARQVEHSRSLLHKEACVAMGICPWRQELGLAKTRVLAASYFSLIYIVSTNAIPQQLRVAYHGREIE